VKRLNSCEGIVAVGRLKLEREAVLEVRISGKGKSEGVVGGRGELGLVVLSWDGMMTEVVRIVVMTELFRTSLRGSMFCVVLV
jgi:hypothetical protein